MGDIDKKRSCKYNRTNAYNKLPETKATSAGSATCHFLELKEVDTFLIHNAEVLPDDSHLQMRTQFPSRESYWGNKLLFIVSYMFISRFPVETELRGIFRAT